LPGRNPAWRGEGIALAFLGFIVFGALIGAVVRMLVAERLTGSAGSMVSGAAGALLSGSVGRIEGLRDSHDSGGFSVALVGAFVAVTAYNFMAVRRARAVALQPTKERP
jgi:uncharacterized membrane protein YeaQ/YmgE (transglycosylase-associated protein family)